MIASPKNFIEQFQNFIEHIAGVMKTFLTKEVADSYYLGKSEKASSASLADTATKATQDANGNVIPETYATKSELTSGLATKQPAGNYPTKSELDSVYLGIKGKAESAKKADFATNANHATSADSAVSLADGLQIQTATSALVTVVPGSLPWTVPADCFIDYIKHGNDSTNNYLRINGNQIVQLPLTSKDGGERLDLKMYFRKGDILSGTKYVYLYGLAYIPYKIS